MNTLIVIFLLTIAIFLTWFAPLLIESIEHKRYMKKKKIENNQAVFKCKGCEHELPLNYSMKNPKYCYLCDPEVTIDELLN